MSALPDGPEMREVVIRIGRSRAIAAGVDPSQYESLCQTLRSAAEWTQAFLAAGDDHAARARRAELEGRIETASEFFRAAAACFHIATTVPNPNRSGHLKASEAMNAALKLSRSGALNLRGERFRGVFIAGASGDAPVVVVAPGLDSSQVEFAANAEALRRRGLSTLTIDGPGQGELASSMPPTPNYESVVSEAIDALLATGARPRSFGLMALSLGGYYGARALAHERRLRAGVTVSGPSRMVWSELPPLLKEILASRTGGVAQAEAFAAKVDVSEIAPLISQPLLVVDGEDDVIPGYENGKRLAETTSNGQYLSIAHGDHLIGNGRWQWLPAAADFLKTQLSI